MTCSFCGKEFFDYHRKGKRERKYCSEECFYAEQRKSRVRRTCLVCGKEFFCQPHAVKKGWGIYCSSKCGLKKKWETALLKIRGVPKSESFKQHLSKIRSGSGSWKWKGGTKMQNGYLFKKTDGLPNGRRYYPIHRIVAETALGRRLKGQECVHHINGDKQDNKNSNLIICDRRYHQWLHKHMGDLYMREKFGVAHA